MELNINSPAYFKDQYGIDNEVYNFCKNARNFFKDREYSETLRAIGITPVAAPNEIYESGGWKEHSSKCADAVAVMVRMDFDKYYSADSAGKIQLTAEAVLRAVKKVKTKGKFDYTTFEKDFREFFEDYK